MTQLVQLQAVADELAEHGFSLFAISNDTVEILSAFAAEQGITFPLLADADSSVIRSFGIMNQLIEPDEGRSMRWHGIAYPGTYYLDGDGVVADKDFHQHHARRASGVSVLARALGRDVAVDESTVTTVDEGEVRIDVGLADPALRLELISELVVTLDVPAGKHLYAAGAPEAFTPLEVEVEGEGIRLGPPTLPEPDELTMSELGLTVPTHAGRVRVGLPITVTSEVVRLGHDIGDALELSVVCRFQVCDELACGLPQRVEVAMSVPLDRLVEPAGIRRYVERVEAIEAETGRPVR
ncbi:MAG: redoxin domain-containing protein [Actinomycetota bacterium]